MLSLEERSGGELTKYELLAKSINNNLRVSMPGIITYFNPVEQIVNVKPCIKEKITQEDGSIAEVELPELLDLPIVIPQAGGYSITFPIQVGDECLVIFGDMCIDAWFSSGDVQSQIESRRHDLSDGFAIIGISSQPKRITNYSGNSMQIRNSDGSAYIDINGSIINLVGTVKINGVVK